MGTDESKRWNNQRNKKKKKQNKKDFICTMVLRGILDVDIIIIWYILHHISPSFSKALNVEYVSPESIF